MIIQFQQSPYILRLVEEFVLDTAERQDAFGAICLKGLFVDTKHFAYLLVIQPVFQTQVFDWAAYTCHLLLELAKADAQFFKSLFINTYDLHDSCSILSLDICLPLESCRQ